MRERESGTPGGAKLRALREQAGRTQLWVEAEADLGTGYLQRVECGRVVQPGRATVERILAALGARYTERRAALELFGYVVATPPPNDEEIAWAREVSRPELHEVAFPAYVLDCMHRLVTWNDYLPRLLGSGPERVDVSTAGAARGRDDPTRIGAGADRSHPWLRTRAASLTGPRDGAGNARMPDLAGRSMLAPWFDPTSPLGALVVEPEQFLPALIRALRYEMQRYLAEEWYARMLAELLDTLPLFRRSWELVAQAPPPASAARALVPVRLDVPGAGTLIFRLSSEPFVRDARFRVIYYFPADPPTMHWCAGWATGTASASLWHGADPAEPVEGALDEGVGAAEVRRRVERGKNLP